ncbi:hypothetical protein [Microbacterium sp. C7(2022)]|uniref:hypothetical protein n=1 Tax=Microbacterium sp. C7(2022) TaxID=2992759 RepID=UPI00237B425B|nr:hypothetical protein [Microbacterium sp. C7(2022)]MDE0547273.1 hypothetical protein [Microbacterium sp. C7(2022)]
MWEAAARLAPGQVFSHLSAAALWGIHILGAWPDAVDVSVDRSRATRSGGAIRRHSRVIDGAAVQPWGTHAVTTPAQTALDLAACLPFVEGVAVADQVLWTRRRGGPLAHPADLAFLAESTAGRGSGRARRVTAFARGGADSVRESQSRVVLATLGFPEPRLQQRFMLPNGRDAFSDFFWPEHSHIGEFDGLDKYRDPALLRGRTPEEALIAEKDREDELRRLVSRFSRWRTPMLTHPQRLYDTLTGAGLPSSRPRPGR